MFSLENLIRDNVKALAPYSSARDEFSGAEGIFLDANENPFGELNRYPDPYQNELKQKISTLKQISANQIFIGNGSDEVIDLIYRIFCEPGRDAALIFSPTYGMYEVSAAINDIKILKVPLTADFQIDLEKTNQQLSFDALKLIFICSPNNPTGNTINRDDILSLVTGFNGIIVIDEAYIDFSDESSWLDELPKYPNLIITQTFSKAWGLAGARVGVAYASEAIIKLLNKIKPPYNVSSLNQEAAILALGNRETFEVNRQEILAEKCKLEEELMGLEFVHKIYPSDANFLLVEVTNPNGLYNYLVEDSIIVRNRNTVVAGCLRITVGSKSENQELLLALKKYRG
jgi:histidinol-phosphate aminotransferase